MAETKRRPGRPNTLGASKLVPFRLPLPMVELLDRPRSNGLCDKGVPVTANRSEVLRYIIEDWCHMHGVRMPSVQCDGQESFEGL